MEPSETAEVAEETLRRSQRSSASQTKPHLLGYVLADKLGEGSFGTAYRATQESTGQGVAVKVLHSVNARFRAEVDRLSLVSDHPHIVTLVDADLDHQPPYLVTPLLSGSLLDQIPQNPTEVDVEKVCGWFRQLAEALEFIHGRGILHCDLKPANVLLGQEGQVRLTDFGQAALSDQDDLHLGSFWFMPWQQTRGGLPEIGWDLYALGATIYTLLAGHPPRSSQAANQALQSLPAGPEQLQAYRQCLQSTPLEPLTHIDPELAAIVDHCLRLEGGYSNAGEVLADLDRRAHKFPVSARPLTRLYWFERFLSRHRLSFAVAVIALSILVAAQSWAGYQIYQARQAQRLLIEQQFDRGRSLLRLGQASGLVWLARAYQLDPRPSYREALLTGLSRQLQIADPSLYRLSTATAPSPSGRWAIWKHPDDPFDKRLVDLTTGQMSTLPQAVWGRDRDQKDKVRFRLDGIELDPHQGSGGPATWCIRSMDSLQPGQEIPCLALVVRPDKVLRAIRSDHGIRVLDQHNQLRMVAERPGKMPQHPTFSPQGELAISWEDGRVERYRSTGSKLVDPTFFADLFCFSPDGRFLAGSDGASRIRLWDDKGQRVAEFSVTAPVNDMTFDPTSSHLVCACRDGLVHGFSLPLKKAAWPPLQLEKAARWVFVQPGGQIVTMSDEVIVWKTPEPLDSSLQDPQSLIREVARRTGWISDQNDQIRTLSQSEYKDRFDRP